MKRRQTGPVSRKGGRIERLEVRVDSETRDLIERAANAARRTVSEFCVLALADTARRTIAEHGALLLSERDRAAFFDALINPPRPSERMMHAFREHQRRIAQ